MSDELKRIKDLLSRATHASTPEEEARTCALIAARLIVSNEVELRAKRDPFAAQAPPAQPPPPYPPPGGYGPPFSGYGSPFGAPHYDANVNAYGSPFGYGSPYPHVPNYDPMYEGMAWSRHPKPCPLCGAPWPRNGAVCPCVPPLGRERARAWARSWGYSVRPEMDPIDPPPAPSPPPPASAPPAPEPKKRARRKRTPKVPPL